MFDKQVLLQVCQTIGGHPLDTANSCILNPIAKKALRFAVFTFAHAHCALKGFSKRVRTKNGRHSAMIATYHKLARIIYKMLKDKFVV